MSDVEWREVVGHPGYMVSNEGRVKHPSGQILKQCRKQSKHLTVWINRKNFYVHRLVLEAFKGKCPIGMQGLHGDDNAENNRVENLRWGTHTENMRDKSVNGIQIHGEKVAGAKLKEDQVIEIRRRIRRESIRSLALEYGVTHSAIDMAGRGKTWKYLKDDVLHNGINHANCKLTEAQVKEIRQRLGHESQRIIAADYGVNQGTISFIKRGLTWRHVQ